MQRGSKECTIVLSLADLCDVAVADPFMCESGKECSVGWFDRTSNSVAPISNYLRVLKRIQNAPRALQHVLWSEKKEKQHSFFFYFTIFLFLNILKSLSERMRILMLLLGRIDQWFVNIKGTSNCMYRCFAGPVSWYFTFHSTSMIGSAVLPKSVGGL